VLFLAHLEYFCVEANAFLIHVLAHFDLTAFFALYMINIYIQSSLVDREEMFAI
jgi:hypothetical protein